MNPIWKKCQPNLDTIEEILQEKNWVQMFYHLAACGIHFTVLSHNELAWKRFEPFFLLSFMLDLENKEVKEEKINVIKI